MKTLLVRFFLEKYAIKVYLFIFFNSEIKMKNFNCFQKKSTNNLFLKEL